MKTTYRKAIEFKGVASKYLEKHKEETKLKYAIEKVLKRLTKYSEQLQEEREDIWLEHAETNELGHVLRDPVTSGYVLTKDTERKAKSALKALLEKPGKVDIEPHYATELPEGLNEDYIEYFVGFVIDPAMVEPENPTEKTKQTKK